MLVNWSIIIVCLVMCFIFVIDTEYRVGGWWLIDLSKLKTSWGGPKRHANGCKVCCEETNSTSRRKWCLSTSWQTSASRFPTRKKVGNMREKTVAMLWWHNWGPQAAGKSRWGYTTKQPFPFLIRSAPAGDPEIQPLLCPHLLEVSVAHGLVEKLQAGDEDQVVLGQRQCHCRYVWKTLSSPRTYYRYCSWVPVVLHKAAAEVSK